MKARDGKSGSIGKRFLVIAAVCILSTGLIGTTSWGESPDQELLDRELREYGEEVWGDFLKTCELPICKFRNYILAQDWDSLYELLDKNHPLWRETKEEFLQNIHHNLQELYGQVMEKYYSNGGDRPLKPQTAATVDFNGFSYMDRYRNQFRIVFNIDYVFNEPAGKVIYRVRVDFTVADMGGKLYPELDALSKFDLSKLYVIRQ